MSIARSRAIHRTFHCTFCGLMFSSLLGVMASLFLFILAPHSLAWAHDNQAKAQAPIISKAPTRVVTLSPALTELIYALRLQSKLVGVSDFSDFPTEAKQKTSVGPYTKPSLEKIFSLHPDLVLIPNEGPTDIKERLDQIKAPYKTITMRKLREIPEAAQEISAILGEKNRGDAFAKNWKTTLNKIFMPPKTAASSANKPSVGKAIRGKPEKDKLVQSRPQILIEVQNSPLIAAGSETFLDEIVTGCGGENIVKQKGYTKISLEVITEQKIDTVLLTDYFSNPSEKSQALENLKKIPSIRHATLQVLDPDFVSRPGPRLLKGAEMICQALLSVETQPQRWASP